MGEIMYFMDFIFSLFDTQGGLYFEQNMLLWKNWPINIFEKSVRDAWNYVKYIGQIKNGGNGPRSVNIDLYISNRDIAFTPVMIFMSQT